MAIVEYLNYTDDGGSIGSDSSERSMTNGTTSVATNTDDGIYQAFIWVNGNSTLTETLTIRVYEKVRSGDTQRLVYKFVYYGQALTQEVLVTPPVVLMHGWDFTAQFSSSGGRTILYSIKRVS